MDTNPVTSQPPRRRQRRIITKIVSLLLITAGTSLADNSIKLEVAAKSQHDDPKGNNPQEVQKRWLEISATVFHLEKPAAVKVEWAFYGDNLDSGQIVKHAGGSDIVNLNQGKSAVINSKPVSFAFTPRHSVRTGKGKRSRSRTVEATGTRYHGWGVRAYVDGKLAGEAYSLPSIKKLIENDD